MDIAYLLFLQELRNATGGCLNSFFAFITNVAVDYYVVIPALILFWAVDKKKGVTVLGSLGTAVCINATLKATFCVYRPWIRSDKVKPLEEVVGGATGYSFPSGHSTSAGGFYGGLISAFRKYKGLCIFFGCMILLVMFSRNFVGVHTPQDVCVGACVGLLGAFIATKILEYVDSHPNADVWVLAGAAGICVIVLSYIYFKSYPMDYVDGVLLVDPKKMTVDGFKDPGVFFGVVSGWFIERRFIRFEIKGTTDQKVLRCLIGAVLYVLYYTAVINFVGKAVGIGVVHFLLQTTGPLLFMTVYPMAFTRLQKA